MLLARHHLDLFSLWVQTDELEPRKRKLQPAQKAKLDDLRIGGVQDHGGWLGSGDLSHGIWLLGIHDLKFQLVQVLPKSAGDTLGE
jgi:hypothetical protein